MGAIIEDVRYNCTGKMRHVQIERTETADEVVIEWINCDNKLRGEVAHYKNVGEEYNSPLLSWRNLTFCSANYGQIIVGEKVLTGVPTDYEYMHQAVQNGFKPAATAYIEPESNEGKQLIKGLPPECGAIPYGPCMIYVFRKACLSDLFDFERIEYLYGKHGKFYLDWQRVKEYADMPLEDFGHKDRCDFDLQNGGYKEQRVITGLVLGYPIESTVGFLPCTPF